MKLYVDDDGYVCFRDGEVFWTLHYSGWEAFLPESDDPCYSTYEYIVPTDDDMGEVQAIYEQYLKLKK